MVDPDLLIAHSKALDHMHDFAAELKQMLIKCFNPWYYETRPLTDEGPHTTFVRSEVYGSNLGDLYTCVMFPEVMFPEDALKTSNPYLVSVTAAKGNTVPPHVMWKVSTSMNDGRPLYSSRACLTAGLKPARRNKEMVTTSVTTDSRDAPDTMKIVCFHNHMTSLVQYAMRVTEDADVDFGSRPRQQHQQTGADLHSRRM